MLGPLEIGADGEEVDNRWLEYRLKHFETENVEFLAFAYDPSGMYEEGAAATQLTTCIEEEGCVNLNARRSAQVEKELPLVISWSEFIIKDTGLPSTEVYVMARRIKEEVPLFKFSFTFAYESKPPMPAGAVAVLVLFTLGSLVSLTIFSLLKLHRKGIIEVRIPKPLRIYCFEGYLSPEEKAAI